MQCHMRFVLVHTALQSQLPITLAFCLKIENASSRLDTGMKQWKSKQRKEYFVKRCEVIELR